MEEMRYVFSEGLPDTSLTELEVLLNLWLEPRDAVIDRLVQILPSLIDDLLRLQKDLRRALGGETEKPAREPTQSQPVQSEPTPTVAATVKENKLPEPASPSPAPAWRENLPRVASKPAVSKKVEQTNIVVAMPVHPPAKKAQDTEILKVETAQATALPETVLETQEPKRLDSLHGQFKGDLETLKIPYDDVGGGILLKNDPRVGVIYKDGRFVLVDAAPEDRTFRRILTKNGQVSLLNEKKELVFGPIPGRLVGIRVIGGPPYFFLTNQAYDAIVGWLAGRKTSIELWPERAIESLEHVRTGLFEHSLPALSPLVSIEIPRAKHVVPPAKTTVHRTVIAYEEAANLLWPGKNQEGDSTLFAEVPAEEATLSNVVKWLDADPADIAKVDFWLGTIVVGTVEGISWLSEPISDWATVIAEDMVIGITPKTVPSEQVAETVTPQEPTRQEVQPVPAPATTDLVKREVWYSAAVRRDYVDSVNPREMVEVPADQSTPELIIRQNEKLLSAWNRGDLELSIGPKPKTDEEQIPWRYITRLDEHWPETEIFRITKKGSLQPIRNRQERPQTVIQPTPEPLVQTPGYVFTIHPDPKGSGQYMRLSAFGHRWVFFEPTGKSPAVIREGKFYLVPDKTRQLLKDLAMADPAVPSSELAVRVKQFTETPEAAGAVRVENEEKGKDSSALPRTMISWWGHSDARISPIKGLARIIIENVISIGLGLNYLPHLAAARSLFWASFHDHHSFFVFDILDCDLERVHGYAARSPYHEEVWFECFHCGGASFVV